ncbi:MAG: LacI family DNA-binding transcriptional regulator [Nitriliruptoraceae bacterium]|nr:LacI family DNA-binding transcriptional regulator [Nitriliruptoraceae bacterium]
MSKVTLREVAAHAGVHISTVSRALDPERGALVNDQTRNRVRAAADELGYQRNAVASGLRRGRTQTLGVVVPDLGNPFYAPFMRGVENHLEGRGLMALMAETQDDHGRLSRVLDHLISRQADAVIVASARSGDERLLRKAQEQIPLVLAVRHLPGAGIPAVTHDDERGGRLAAEHLISHGHRRVAQLHGPRDVSSFRGRGRGFVDRMRESGITVREPDDAAGRPRLEEGRRLMKQLLAESDDLPTALFAHNDLMAFGALQAMGERGLSCPLDMAIVGYNDTPMTAFTDPPITTIRLPGYELGRMAADTAVSVVENGPDELKVLSLPPELVPRDSTLRWTRRG